MNTCEELPGHIEQRRRTWLVTGAAGFIGSHLAERLLRLGQAVVGLDNFSTGKRDNLLQVRALVGEAAWKSFRFVEGDLRSLETCREACRSVELVLHQAALGSVPRSLEDPLASHQSNVDGFVNLLLAARDAGVARLVYASSSAVYGDHAVLPRQEDAVGRPLSPYGLGKRVNELYAGVFAACYGLDSIGLRYFNVFGPRQHPEGAYAAVVPAFIRALLRGEQAWINGDGSAARDFCYVENAVQANLLAATTRAREALNQVYNVAVGEQTGIAELFALVRRLVAQREPRARDAQAAHRPPRRGDVAHSHADLTRAARLLGYRPTVRIEQGLARTIDWYREQLLPTPRKENPAYV